MKNNNMHTQQENITFGSIIANKQFRLLWIIGGFTSCMRWLDMIILGIYTFELTNSAFLVGLIFFYRTIPRLLFGTIIGMVTDRFNRKKILTASFMILCVVYFIVALLIYTEQINYTLLSITMFIAGICWANEFPVRRAMIGDVIPTKVAGKAFGIDIGTSAFTRIIGPALGGGILATLGPMSGYMTVSIVFFVVSLICLKINAKNQQLDNSTKNKSIKSFFIDIVAGFKYIKNTPILQGTLAITLVMNLFAFPYFNMVPIIGKEILNANPFQIGLLGAIEGTGALIGASLIATKVTYQNYGRLYFFGSIFLTCLIFIFAFSNIYYLSMLILFIAGFGMVSFATMQTTLAIVSSSTEMRGRTMGALSFAIGAGPIGSLSIGLLASNFGAQNSLKIVAVLGFCFMLIAGYFWSDIRKKLKEDN